MSVLLLRLAGPMQAWGTQSRFSVRDTGLEPSKSGVLGLLCAAMGKPRNEQPGDSFPTLRELAEQTTMGVRVDRPGIVACDYHTAKNVLRAGAALKPGKPPAKQHIQECVTSHRYYLADADFLVALEGPQEVLARLEAALASPVWPLYLGRKAFPPAMPVRVPGGLRADGALPDALRIRPWWRRTQQDQPPEEGLRIIVEQRPGEEGEVRNDVPLRFVSRDRAFTVRRVCDVEFWDIANDAPELIQDWPPCTSQN